MGLKQQFLSVFGRQDAVLASAGVLGILLFILAAPHQHPDRAAMDHIPREEAISEARAFAETAARLHLEDTEVAAEIERRPQLVDSLQLLHGRREAIRQIRSADLPAYFWSVSWSRRVEDGTDRLASVYLTLSGVPIGLTTDAGDLSTELRHDEALAAVLTEEEQPDSLQRLSFRFDEEREEAAPGQVRTGGRLFLNRSDAVALARFHLRGTGLFDEDLQVDSVFVSGEDGVVTATVRVSAAKRELGQWYTADVEIIPSGILVGLDPSFVRTPEAEGDMSAEDILELSSMLLFALLGLILVVVFFRRINARLVDTRSALRDGTIGGLAAGVAMTAQITGGEMPDSAVEAAIMLVGIVLTSFAAAAFVFFISGAATSVARDRWESRLRSLDLARKFFVRNIPVGLALVRGVFGGFVLLGLLTVVLILFTGIAVHHSSSEALFATDYPALSALQAVSGQFFFAFFASYTVILGFGGLLRLLARRTVASMGAIVFLLALFAISPISLRPIAVEFAVSALMGVGIAWMFWRFDALTAMTSLFILLLTAASLIGLTVPSAPEFVGAVLILLAVCFVFGLGAAGAISGKTSAEVPVIVPEYIEELAQRERLKRELELGREVQLSFLPETSPTCPGLDIASICLPAHEVGGDYYDFFPAGDQRLSLVVGDVSGKGMQAAFYMTLMKGILQSTVTDVLGPGLVLRRANEIFRMNAPRGAFMSMVLGTFDTAAGTWTFARAGHNPVLIHRQANGTPESVQPNGAAIGLASDLIFSQSLEERVVQLSRGDLVLVYTDGVTEAMNERRDLYDDARLHEVVARTGGKSAQEVIEAIIDDVDAFCGSAPRHDDMTMVAVRIT